MLRFNRTDLPPLSTALEQSFQQRLRAHLLAEAPGFAALPGPAQDRHVEDGIAAARAQGFAGERALAFWCHLAHRLPDGWTTEPAVAAVLADRGPTEPERLHRLKTAVGGGRMGWLNDVWNAITGVFSDDPPAAPVNQCDGALSPEEAQALFDDLAAQADIPFDYAPDCCYARADRMSQIMTDRGIENGKARAYAGPLGALRPTTESGGPVEFPAGSPVLWGYHVAPTVSVRQPDGTCRDMVMDPSLRDRPLTVEEWEGLMGGAATSASTGNDIYYRNSSGSVVIERGDLTDAERIDQPFASHRAARDAALP